MVRLRRSQARSHPHEATRLSAAPPSDCRNGSPWSPSWGRTLPACTEFDCEPNHSTMGADHNRGGEKGLAPQVLPGRSVLFRQERLAYQPGATSSDQSQSMFRPGPMLMSRNRTLNRLARTQSPTSNNQSESIFGRRRLWGAATCRRFFSLHQCRRGNSKDSVFAWKSAAHKKVTVYRCHGRPQRCLRKDSAFTNVLQSRETESKKLSFYHCFGWPPSSSLVRPRSASPKTQL